MVSVLIFGSSGLGSGPGQEHCVVFLGKTLYSHSASLHPQSATKLVETVANRAHWQCHIHCLQRKLVQKVRFRDTPPSSTLINVVPLSTRLIENRKTQHCPGGAGEGAICAPTLKSTKG